MQYSGKWRITEMEMWDRDYFDMEVEAYIQINANGSGEFQFGLVCGQIRGKCLRMGRSLDLDGMVVMNVMRLLGVVG